MKRKIVLGITGASGAIYASVLMEELSRMNHIADVAVVVSDNARTVWEKELQEKMTIPFKEYGKNDFFAPFASGSAGFDAMIICPCSMGTLGRIAHGISNDLMTRSADVMLKERRKLVLVAREMPYSLIHIRNMETITMAGGIICPATPSFYGNPISMRDLAATVVHRALDLIQLPVDKTFRWGSSAEE